MESEYKTVQQCTISTHCWRLCGAVFVHRELGVFGCCQQFWFNQTSVISEVSGRTPSFNAIHTLLFRGKIKAAHNSSSRYLLALVNRQPCAPSMKHSDSRDLQWTYDRRSSSPVIQHQRKTYWAYPHTHTHLQTSAFSVEISYISVNVNFTSHCAYNLKMKITLPLNEWVRPGRCQQTNIDISWRD